MVKVLIALDNHKATLKGFQWYLENVFKITHEISIMHLAKPPTLLTGATPEAQEKATADFNAAEQKLEQQAKELMEKNNVPDDLYKYFSIEPSDHSMKAESIAKDIIKEIENQGVDMIVMGCRNTKMKKFLGSVSDYVVKNASCVCLVKKFEAKDL